MIFKHYYPLIPISRPLQLALATGCIAAGAYYIYRHSISTSKEDSTISSEPEAETSLDLSNELISVNHLLPDSYLYGMFESYLIHRPYLTSSRLSLLEDEAGGAKKRKGDSKYNYSSTTSECTTDLSGDKLEGSDPPVDLDESSFGDVVLVLKDDNERNYDYDSSDTSDDSHNVTPMNWSPHLLPGEEELEEEEEQTFEIEYVEHYF